MMDDPLAALRPLHTPPPVGWWPPAPGWWIVLLLVLALAVMIYRYRRRRAPQRRALQELKLLRRDPNAATLNQLLKRYALACWPAETVAPLSGEAWLAFLDASGGNGKFSDGSGRLLLSGPYQQHCADLRELIALADQWIKTNTPRKN